MLHEAPVALSDFALGAVSAFLALRLCRTETELLRIRTWFGVELGAIALAALFGGLSHGFFPGNEGLLGALIWRLSLVLIGVAALGALMLASFLLFRPTIVERLRLAAILAFAVYSGVVLFEWQDFVIALAFYLPPAILLSIAFLARWRRAPASFAADGVIAMFLTFLAAAIQHFDLGIHPVFLNNNVLYHMVQAVATFFLYRAGIRWLGLQQVRISVETPSANLIVEHWKSN